MLAQIRNPSAGPSGRDGGVEVPTKRPWHLTPINIDICFLLGEGLACVRALYIGSTPRVHR